MIKLTIDRAKWACETNNDARSKANITARAISAARKPYENSGSCLLDEDGFKCCLGFLGSACRIKKLYAKSTPIDIPNAKWPKGILVRNPDGETINSKVTDALIDANDNFVTVTGRENAVRRLMKKIGVSVTYKGKYLEEK